MRSARKRFTTEQIIGVPRAEGWRANLKRFTASGGGRLKVPQKQPKRGRLWLNDGSCIRLRPEHPSTLDAIVYRRVPRISANMARTAPAKRSGSGSLCRSLPRLPSSAPPISQGVGSKTKLRRNMALSNGLRRTCGRKYLKTLIGGIANLPGPRFWRTYQYKSKDKYVLNNYTKLIDNTSSH